MIFCLIIRLPPDPTPTASLFPDTTLFRSCPSSEEEGRPMPAHHPKADLRHTDTPPSPESARDSRRRPARRSAGGRRSEIAAARRVRRSEEHTSELQSLMRISYAVFCLKKKKIY